MGKMTDDASRLTETLPKGPRPHMEALYSDLTGAGSIPHVKTIYIGFALDGEMVAAAYPHAASIEVALALAEDHPGSDLQDATHLTWRTMPLSIEVSDGASASAAREYAQVAVQRVREGVHDVHRDNEHFIRSRLRALPPPPPPPLGSLPPGRREGATR